MFPQVARRTDDPALGKPELDSLPASSKCKFRVRFEEFCSGTPLRVELCRWLPSVSSSDLRRKSPERGVALLLEGVVSPSKVNFRVCGKVCCSLLTGAGLLPAEELVGVSRNWKVSFRVSVALVPRVCELLVPVREGGQNTLLLLPSSDTEIWAVPSAHSPFTEPAGVPWEARRGRLDELLLR